MSVRDLSLAVRAEDVREARRIPVPVHFSREQIKNHFNESIEAVKEQFDVAESLFQSDNKEGCKMIWRSQIVLAEGLLDFYLHEVSIVCFRGFLIIYNQNLALPNLINLTRDNLTYAILVFVVE